MGTTGVYPQTTVTQFPAAAFAGQLGSSWAGLDVAGGVVSESGGVDAGMGVILDGDPTLLPGYAQKFKYPTGSGSVIAGFVALREMREAATPVNALYADLSVVRKGEIWVNVANTVVQGNDVYVLYTGNIGQIRADSGSSTAVKARGCTVLIGGTSGGIAKISVNLPLATSDAAAGQIPWNVTGVKTSAYNAVIGDFVRVDPTAGTVTITLPTAVGVTGQSIRVADVAGQAATHTITVGTSASQTINGASTKTITTNYGEVIFVSDGANWMAA